MGSAATNSDIYFSLNYSDNGPLANRASARNTALRFLTTFNQIYKILCQLFMASFT